MKPWTGGLHTTSYGEPVIVTDIRVRLRPRTPEPSVDTWPEYIVPPVTDAPAQRTVVRTRREPRAWVLLAAAFPAGVLYGGAVMWLLSVTR